MTTFYKKVSISVVCFVLFLSLTPVASAAGTYFGGKVTQVVYCTCLYYPGVVITLDDYSSNHQTVKVFYSVWLSRLFANYNIWTAMNQYVIGGYIPGAGVCMNQSGYSCSTNSNASPDGMIDMIRGIGSSL